MNPIQRLGLIVNPIAGRGLPHNLAAARQAVKQLGCAQIVTGAGNQGQNAVADLERAVEVLPTPNGQGRAATQELARSLIQTGVEALLVVGGDGTLSDVAYVIVDENAYTLILGIGAGSTNAGTLVTAKAGELAPLCWDELTVRSAPALLAYRGSHLAGVGFNDCVLGFTVVATVDGKLRNVDVNEKVAGRIIPGQPGSIGSGQTAVWKSGPGGEETLGQGRDIAAVVVGLAEPTYIAKALTGGVCLAAFTGVRAGCLVTDFPLVQVELNAEQVLSLPPIHSTYTSLNASSQIHVKGCRPGTGLCVDGNPLCILTEKDEVSFTLRESAVHVVKTKI